MKQNIVGATWTLRHIEAQRCTWIVTWRDTWIDDCRGVQSKACCLVLLDIRFMFSIDGFHHMCMTRAIHDRQLTRVVVKLKKRLTLHSMNQHMLMCCWCVSHSCTLVCWSLTEITSKTQIHMWNFSWNVSQKSTLVGRSLVETSTKFRHVSLTTGCEHVIKQ